MAATYVNDYTAILSGSYYNPYLTQGRSVILTYSFDAQGATGSNDPAHNPFSGILDEQHKILVRAALATWSANAGISFIETTRHEGDLNFAYYSLADANAAGDARLPSSGAFFDTNSTLKVYGGNSDLGSGVVRLDDITRNYTADNFTHVVLHEFGHALGLKHPFEGNIQLTPAFDSTKYTVMSYQGYAPKLGPLDEAAIQAIYGPKGNTSPFAWSWNSTTETLTQIGTAGGDYIKGTRANNVIDTAGGVDTIVTYGGNDTIVTKGQSLQVNAGAGFDIVMENVAHSSLSFLQYDQAQSYAYVTLGSATQTLVNVERLQFTDGTMALDLGGVAGEAYRLYKAAFDRTPDTAGLSYWVKALDAGMILDDVAAGFVQSSEFNALYSTSQGVQGFVSKLYHNVLGRDGEASGMNYWEGQLASGMTKAGMLASFSESPENIVGVAPSISHGIWLA